MIFNLNSFTQKGGGENNMFLIIAISVIILFFIFIMPAIEKCYNDETKELVEKLENIMNIKVDISDALPKSTNNILDTRMEKTIIQIGSHVGDTQNDPIFNLVDDNTKLILVEPVPFLFNQLQINYTKKFKNNKNIIFINKAASDFIGEIEMTIPSEKNDFTKLPFWASQLASVNSEHALGHINDLLVEKINVKTTTINEIVEQYNIKQIDLLHTDTEGHDYIILMNYNFKIKPKQIMFEHKHMDGLGTVGSKYDELSNKLFSLGYKKIQQNSEDSTFELDTYNMIESV
jgi:FkbM family methyltransferase